MKVFLFTFLICFTWTAFRRGEAKNRSEGAGAGRERCHRLQAVFRPGGRERYRRSGKTAFVLSLFPVLRTGCFSRIRFFSFPDPGFTSKNLSILTQKRVSKLSEIWSRLFIPDPDPDFLPVPGPKRHWIPDLDPQHWLFLKKYLVPGCNFYTLTILLLFSAKFSI